MGKNIGRTLNREVAVLNSGLNARFSEYIKGIPLVRSFRLEEWAEGRINQSISAWLAAALRMNIATATIRPLIGLSSQFPLLITLWIGFREVQTDAIGIGVFVTFLRLCERFSSPVVTLSQELHQMQTAFASAERVASMVKEETEDAVLGPDGPVVVPHLRGAIGFEGVTLYYDRNSVPALKNISFTIAPGETVGFVGKTGSGKSSTVALIARLYQQSAGKILLDGHPIEELNRQSLRSAIGFVTQDPVIFSGTMRENLSLDESVTDNAIMETCSATGLANIMIERQLTLGAHLTESGNNLSAGERQVVALTRMLLQNPSVIILDEATANIDEGLEHTLHTALVALTASRTTIIIAHRLSTLKACDRILVFQDGALVEQGTHESLLTLRGYYFELAHTTI
jgi:ABC-type multidrug transport system fused ATPase/permease subunit